MGWIDVKNLFYQYKVYSGDTDRKGKPDDQDQVEGRRALSDLSLSINKGDFVGILGHNGSGKTTLARQLAALLFPDSGQVFVGGLNSADPGSVLLIRKKAGMIFQNPDNQIIGNIVEEDVAFGPENLGIPAEEIDQRIAKALETTGMQAYRMANPSALSGGQKQKTAISGVLAMEPECIIFDEPTAMIDPESRKGLLQAIYDLNRTRKITIIYITHSFEDLDQADYLYIMKEGRLADQGSPLEFMDSPGRLLARGIALPFRLRLQEEISRQENREAGAGWKDDPVNPDRIDRKESPGEPMREGLLLQDISFSYDNQWAGDNKPALSHINLSVQPGEFTAIIGPTGSGKTTLIKHLNALLRPGEGNIFFHGRDIWESSFSRRDLRCKVGLCFQIPDYQFFEETLIRDIAFGPRNMGLPEEECLERARRAMTLMGLPPELETVSPFSLSGGQKRRAAIAGILAMEPEYLVLDEPAAGMDSEGRETLYRILHTLNEDRGITILFVTHDMNDVADHARRVIVMEDGRIRMDGSPRDIFSRREELAGLGLGLPEAAAYYLDHCREEEHFLPLTVSELARILRKRAESRQEDVSKCDIGTIL